MVKTLLFTKATLLSVNIADNSVTEKTVTYNKIVTENRVKKDYPDKIIKSVENLQQTYELSDEIVRMHGKPIGEAVPFVRRKKTTE